MPSPEDIFWMKATFLSSKYVTTHFPFEVALFINDVNGDLVTFPGFASEENYIFLAAVATTREVRKNCEIRICVR